MMNRISAAVKAVVKTAETDTIIGVATCARTRSVRKQKHAESSVAVLVPVNEKFQKEVYYPSHPPIHTSRSYYDRVPSEMLKSQIKVAFEMRNQPFSHGQYSITGVSLQRNLSDRPIPPQIHKGDSVWICGGFMNAPALGAIK